MTKHVKMVKQIDAFGAGQLTVGETYKVFKVLEDGSGDVWIFDDFGCRNVLYSGEWESVNED